MVISIRDLKEGITEFEKVVPSQNYTLADSDFYPNPFSLKVFVDKLEDLFRFKISISTEAAYTCDRCLKSYDYRIDEQIEQIYHIGQSDLGDEEIEILPDNSREIDISKAVEDAIRINRPIRLICNENCKGLCPGCGTNLNKKSCQCKDDHIDPRLEKLKSLLK